MHEKTMSALVTGLAGANLIYGMGQLESGLTYSSQQLVTDNDIVKMAKRVIRGIDVTDETMAVDIIKQSHEIKDFLRQKHTIKFMREEQSRPKLMDRTTRGTWEEAGSKDLNQRAREETSRILKTHKPTPLPEEVQKELRDIVAAAEKEVAPA